MRTRAPKLPIARQRDYFSVVFQGTAVVHRSTWVSDGMGGGTTTFAAVGTVKCLISCDGKPREMTLAGQTQSVIPWSVDMPHDADVRSVDRIVAAEGTFEVLGCNHYTSQATYLRATCVKLQTE